MILSAVSVVLCWCGQMPFVHGCDGHRNFYQMLCDPQIRPYLPFCLLNLTQDLHSSCLADTIDLAMYLSHHQSAL